MTFVSRLACRARSHEPYPQSRIGNLDRLIFSLNFPKRVIGEKLIRFPNPRLLSMRRKVILRNIIPASR